MELEYAQHDGVRLAGTFFASEEPGARPVVIAIHGGAWSKGNMGYFRNWGEWLSKRGISVFSIEYRLVRGETNTYPAAIMDVRAAIQFVRAKADELHIDPKRIGLMGASAGAHLAALVALAGDAEHFAGGYPSDPHCGIGTEVKAVVAVCGVYDLLAQWRHDQYTRPLDRATEIFLDATPMVDRRRYFDASPISYTTVHKNNVSFLVSWGLEDDVVPWREQSEPFVEALKRANYYVRIAPIAAVPHFWIYDPVDEPHSANVVFAPKLLRFLQQRL